MYNHMYIVEMFSIKHPYYKMPLEMGHFYSVTFAAYKIGCFIFFFLNSLNSYSIKRNVLCQIFLSISIYATCEMECIVTEEILQ